MIPTNPVRLPNRSFRPPRRLPAEYSLGSAASLRGLVGGRQYGLNLTDVKAVEANSPLYYREDNATRRAVEPQ